MATALAFSVDCVGRAGRQRGQRRERDVVLDHLATGLGQELVDPLPGFVVVHPLLDDLADLHVLQADAPFEAEREQGVVQQVEQVEALPALVAGDAQQAVADVVVHPEDVGVLVVHEVVGVAPVLGRPAHVPLPRRGVNLRVVHPVPLAVHDVVADLHVLDDLGHAQGHGARPPGRTARTGGQHQPAGYLQRALRCDGAADVAGVARAARVFNVLADGIQLNGQAFDVGVRQMGEYVDVGDRHRLHLLQSAVPDLRYRNLRIRRLPVSSL